MNPFAFIVRRPITSFVLIAGLAGGSLVGMAKMGVKTVNGVKIPEIFASISLSEIGERAQKLKSQVTGLYEHYFPNHEEQAHHGGHHKIIVTSPKAQDVVIPEQYVCQIHSRRHINVCAYDNGYLEDILVNEGQAVKKGDPLFKIIPVLYKAKLDAEVAEADLAEMEFKYAKQLSDQNVVSPREVALHKAKLAKAQAKASLARAELNFTNVTAPFDGIVDRLHEQLGSLIKEGDVLTTLSDNSTMWVYFNVPEKRYLEYMAGVKQNKPDPKIELMLANGEKFPVVGKIGAIEAKFNNETGNIPFRADFPNPDRLLRHGQTGTILLSNVTKGVTVIPQRATFEILAKRYVYVVDKDKKVHQREIEIQDELEDVFVIKKGLKLDDKIVLEGLREVHDGEEVEYEFSAPELVMSHLKNHAE